jgi:ketosteroid isomerase-like protein
MMPWKTMDVREERVRFVAAALPQKSASVVLLSRLSPIAFSYNRSRFVQPFCVPCENFGRNARRRNGRGNSKERALHWQTERGEKMTAAELMHNNFDKIFIELDPVKREAMMRNAYTEDCVWIHPGGRLVGVAAVNQAASEIRKHIPEYRYKVVGDIQTMHNVGMCRWGSGLPGQPFRYTGTDVLEERDGRVAVFYTFIDSGTPPVSSTE